MFLVLLFFFFFFNDTATTEIYTLSLHDALPIFDVPANLQPTIDVFRGFGRPLRSEEHTSELQSQSNLVCRLLLEKKKNKKNTADTSTPEGYINDSQWHNWRCAAALYCLVCLILSQ